MFKKAWLTIGVIVLVLVLLLLSTTGCGIKYPEYEFSGKIGDEKVEFFATDRFTKEATYILRVVKVDGAIIEYVDFRREDLKLEWVDIISPKGEKTGYRSDSSNPAVQAVVVEAQKQFDEYLKKIMEIKTSPLRPQEK